MLWEKHSRTLTIAKEALMQDFEPRDAIPYMCSKEIFSEDQQEAILGMPTRTLRVLEFIRQYRKTADKLEPLISYFEEHGQKHLVNILSREYIAENRPLLSSTALENRLYVEGNAPRLPFHRVERNELLQNLEKILISLSFQSRFWLVIHGFPGCGKSFLAADVLTRPILLSRYYEHVIWVSDGCTNVTQLPELFSNFVFLATDALVLTGKETPVQFLPLARAALRDKPNVLVVMDDVYLSESVRWFDQLNCRILATSRNLEIFQVTSTKPIHFAIHPPGFSLLETEKMLSEMKQFMNSPTYMEELLYIHKETAGLPAVLSILKQQSYDHSLTFGVCNLRNTLNYHSTATLSQLTYYKYVNMTDAIMISYNGLTQQQKMAMETFLFFDRDDWIPLELISLCIPIDIPGMEDIMFITMLELEPLIKSSLLDKRINESCNTYLHRPVCDFHINPVMYSFLYVTVNPQSIEDRLRLYIRPNVSSVLSGQHAMDSDFVQRVRSYTDLRPSLFRQIPCKECHNRSRFLVKHTAGAQYNRLDSGFEKYTKECDNNDLLQKKVRHVGISWTDSCMFI